MYKQSPSRNHRGKGVKVKHILQICLLIAVCFWLIYQVKHSHDKKKMFDAKGAKIAAQVESNDAAIRFGRKDIPRVKIATKDEKLGDEEEVNEGEEEEIKLDEDDREREEVKTDEREEEEEDVSRGAGDDEIDEHEQEKNEAEADREEFVDEGRDREEEDEKSEENEDGKSHAEGDDLQDDQDRDAGSRNTHEAREENYKADDASSEVAQDVKILTPETANITIEFTDENLEVSNSETNASYEARDEGIVAEHGIPSVSTAKGEQIFNSSNVNGSSLLSSTISRGSNNPSADLNTSAVTDDNEASLLPKGTQAIFNLTQIQNSTADVTTSYKGNDLQANPSELTDSSQLASGKIQLQTTGSNSTADVNTTTGELLNSSFENTASGEEKDGSANLTRDSKTEVGVNSETGGANEDSDSQSINDIKDAVIHDPIDASDSSIPQEEKESRMDLSTLPDIRDEVHAEDAVAE